MEPKEGNIRRKPLGALFNFIPNMGHTWECENCGAKEMYLTQSPYDNKGIKRLASRHKCDEEKTTRKDWD